MEVENRRWARLDNASNIFLAARNDIDTKVFRFTAELNEAVDPELLQEALLKTYNDYPLFQNTLRRGLFWYYLEPYEALPEVKKEYEPPCTQIYHYDRKEFLFRVLYFDNRVHLEAFHALTDGTGAFWFFEDLLAEYVRLKYTESFEEEDSRTKREKADLEDSFRRYFKKKKKEVNIPTTNKPLEDMYIEHDLDEEKTPEPTDETVKKKVYQIKGEKTPDHRPRVINVSLPVKPVLNLARTYNVSLTMYLTALYMLAVYKAKETKEEETTITTSIPINLRQFYPSVSVRNFFSTTTVSYTFKQNEEPNVEDICQTIDTQFKAQLDKEELENRLRRFIQFEFNPFTRVIFRPIKDFILKMVNKFNNRKVTIAMSNLGRANLPEELARYIENIYFYTSVIRPQFCMISYAGKLNISFTSPFIKTDSQREFVRLLTSQGIDVSIDSNKVTREELNDDAVL